MKPIATPTVLDALKTTAENIRSLLTDIGTPYRARMDAYKAWLGVVEQAIAAEEQAQREEGPK